MAFLRHRMLTRANFDLLEENIKKDHNVEWTVLEENGSISRYIGDVPFNNAVPDATHEKRGLMTAADKARFDTLDAEYVKLETKVAGFPIRDGISRKELFEGLDIYNEIDHYVTTMKGFDRQRMDRQNYDNLVNNNSISSNTEYIVDEINGSISTYLGLIPVVYKIQNATNQEDGLMSKEDKIELGEIRVDFDAYVEDLGLTIQTISHNISNLRQDITAIQEGRIIIDRDEYDELVNNQEIKDSVEYIVLEEDGSISRFLGLKQLNVEIPLATSTNDGLMSKEDKTRIDALDAEYVELNTEIAGIAIGSGITDRDLAQALGVDSSARRVMLTREDYDQRVESGDIDEFDMVEYTVIEPSGRYYSRYIGTIPLSTGGGGGGGGGSSADFVFRLDPIGSSRSMTVILGKEHNISFYFENSDFEDDVSTGIFKLIKNDRVVLQINEAKPKEITTIDIEPYVTAGSNTIMLEMTDLNGTTKRLPISPTGYRFSVSTTFKEDEIRRSNLVTFPFTVVGPGSKTVYFEITNKSTNSTTTQTRVVNGDSTDNISLNIQNGPNIVRMYAQATIGEETITTNVIDSIVIVNSRSNPLDNRYKILASKFTIDEVTTNDIIEIPFIAYDPDENNPNVIITGNVNDEETTKSEFVIRSGSFGKWTIGFLPVGTHVLTLATEGYVLTWTATVTEATGGISNVDDGSLQTFLTALGRSNQETPTNRSTWRNSGSFGQTYPFNMTGFNFNSNGWIDGRLVFNGKSTAVLDYKPFAENVGSAGLTIEVEFDTPAVHDGSPIIECVDRSGLVPVGFEIKANAASIMPRTGATRVDTYFGENEKIKVSFVIDQIRKRVFIYVNGVLTEESEIKSGFNMAQSRPQPIKFNNAVNTNGYVSNFNVYNFRVYNRTLSAEEILNNYIYDITDGQLKVEEYYKSQIYDETKEVDINLVKNILPVMNIEFYRDYLPQTKEDRPVIKRLTYENIEEPHLNFDLSSVGSDTITIRTQGTSSLQYPIKNYRFNGNMLKKNPVYLTDDGSRPAEVLNIKADYTDSSLTTNSTLVRMFEQMYDYGTPPMELVGDSDLKYGGGSNIKNPHGIRTTIFAGLTAVFHTKSEGGKPEFVGVYSLNNDKSEPAVYGHGLKENGEKLYPHSRRYEISQNMIDHASSFYERPGITNIEWYRQLATGFELSYPKPKGILEDLIEDPDSINNNNLYEIEPYYDELSDLIKFVARIPLVESYNVSSKMEPSVLEGLNFVRSETVELEFDDDGNPVFEVDQDGNITDVQATYIIVKYTLDGTDNTEEHLPNNEKIVINMLTRTVEKITESSDFESELLVDVMAYLTREKYLDVSYELSGLNTSQVNQLKSDFTKRFDMEYTVKYFVVASMFGLLDSLGKNAQLNLWTPSVKDGSDNVITPGKWFFTFYDLDTAIGVDNRGNLTGADGKPLYDYNIELEYGNTFAQSNSKLWKTLTTLFPDEIKSKYIDLRNGIFSIENTFHEFFDKGVKEVGKALYNESHFFKYVDSPGTTQYMNMLHGDRHLQIKGWLTNRFNFLDTKYRYAISDSERTLDMRMTHGADNIPRFNIISHFHQYATVQFGNPNVSAYTVSERAEAYVPVVVTSPHTGGINFTETGFYAAENLSKVTNLKDYEINVANFGKAINMTELDLGVEQEETRLREISFGNKGLLQRISLKNRKGITADNLDFSGYTELKYLNLENTGLLSVTLPVGGILEELILPSGLVSLNLTAQHYLQRISYENLTDLDSLLIDDTPIDLVDILSQVRSTDLKLRVVNYHLSTNDKDWLLELVDKIYNTNTGEFKIKGLSIDNEELPIPQIFGDIIVKTPEDYTPEEYAIFETVFGNRLNINVISNLDGIIFEEITEGQYEGGYVITAVAPTIGSHINIPFGMNPKLDSNEKVYLYNDSDWMKIVGIGDNVFLNNEEVEYISMPSSIEFVGNFAFSGCSNLKTIHLSPNIKSIGNNAFFNNYSLELTSIPSNIEYFGNFAFFNTKNLPEFIYLTTNVKEIGASAFGGSTVMNHVNFLMTYEELDKPISWDDNWNVLGDKSTEYWGLELRMRNFSFDTLSGGEYIPVKEGFILEQLPVAVRDGYTFERWLYNGEPVPEPFVPGKGYPTTIVLEAEYSYTEYNLIANQSFEIYGGEYDIPKTFTIADFPIQLTPPTKLPDYVSAFTGWRLGSRTGRLVTQLTKADFGQDGKAKDIVIYGDWTYENFNITYKGIQGAESANTNISRFNLGTLPVNLNGLDVNADGVPYEHHFVTWIKESENGDVDISNRTMKITEPGNITLHAYWGIEYRMASDNDFVGTNINNLVYIGRLSGGRRVFDKYVIIPKTIRGFEAHFTENYEPANNSGLFNRTGVIGFRMEHPEYLESMRGFFDRSIAQKITLEELDARYIKTMYRSFTNTSLTTLDLNVKNPFYANKSLEEMFEDSSIENINFNGGLSDMFTENVQNTQGMFRNAYIGNQNISLRLWNTDKLTEVRDMFRGTIMNTLNLSGFKLVKTSGSGVPNIINIDGMFYGAKIQNINGLGTWDTSSVMSMTETFKELETESLEEIQGWNTSSLVYMNQMFEGSKIGYDPIVSDVGAPLDLSNWDVSNVTSANRMFRLSKFSALTMNTWNTVSLEDASNMFSAIKLEELDINEWNLQNLISAEAMFYSSAIGDLKIDNWVTDELVNTIDMFRQFSTSNPIDISTKMINGIKRWNTSNIKTTSYMFALISRRTGDSVMPDFTIRNWDLSNVTSLDYLFLRSNFSNLDIFGWTLPEKPYNLINTFRYLNANKIDISTWDTSYAYNWTYAFASEVIHQDANNGKNNILILGAKTFNLMSASNVNYMFTNFRGKFVIWDPYANGSEAVEITDSEINTYLQLNDNGKTLDFTQLTGWKMSNTLIPSYMFSGIEINKLIVAGMNIFNASLRYMFANTDCQIIGLETWDVSGVNDFSYMFYNATAKNLNIDNWNTGSANLMNNMFQASGADIDISGWAVSNVTNMNRMFDSAYIRTLNLSNWTTNNLVNMEGIFNDSEATIINVTGWDVSKVINMYEVFKGTKDTGLSGVTTWNVSNVTNMKHMFMESAVINLDLSGWNVDKVTDMSYMFSGAGVTNLNLDGWNTEKLVSMTYMFNNTTLVNLDISHFNISKVQSIEGLLSGSEILGTLTIAGENWSDPSKTNLRNIAGAFGVKISTLDLSEVNVSKVTNMSSAFYGADVGAFNINNWDTSNVELMDDMFRNSKFNNLDLQDLDVSKVKSFRSMFQDINSEFNVYPNINLTGWVFKDVQDMRNMFFKEDPRLTSGLDHRDLILSGWDFTLVPDGTINMSGMFRNNRMTDFTGEFFKLDSINMAKSNNTSYMFYAEMETPLNLGTVYTSWDMSNVRNTSYMFNSRVFNTQLNLSSWRLESVEDASYMFYGMVLNSELSALNRRIQLPNFRAHEYIPVGQAALVATNMSNMFGYAKNISSINLTGLKFSSEEVIRISNMFYEISSPKDPGIPVLLLNEDIKLLFTTYSNAPDNIIFQVG